MIGQTAAYIFVTLNATSRTSHLWPVVAAIALFVITLALALAASTRHSGGHLVYALDDPYIHMAMAKNVAAHRVWGVSGSHFTSSSSSLFWTAMLAVLFVALGIHQVIPFVVNALLAIALLFVAFRQLSRDQAGLPSAYQFAVLPGSRCSRLCRDSSLSARSTFFMRW